MTAPIVLLLSASSIMTFLMFWWDKHAARTGRWRLRESTLLAGALMGGSLGAVIAQRMLRHKTRKEPFRTRLMMIVGLHAILLGLWLAAAASPPAWPTLTAGDAYSRTGGLSGVLMFSSSESR